MNNYLNFNTHKQVAFEYRNASKGFIGDTSKMLAPAGDLYNQEEKDELLALLVVAKYSSHYWTSAE